MQEIALLVERVQDSDADVQLLALNTIRSEIKSATSSMTSVPKPLKFLRPHYPVLVTFFDTMADSNNKRLFADILSVLAMTLNTSGESTDSLKFKLQGTVEHLEMWGHEYVRNLTGEIAREFTRRTDAQPPEPVDDLLHLVDHIVPFHMTHHAEPDACDLLLEVSELPRLVPHADEENYSRVCNYLLSCSYYVPEPDDVTALRVALDIYRKMNKPAESLRVAMKLRDMDVIRDIFDSCDNRIMKMQLAFMLARQHLFVPSEDQQLVDIMSNTNLSESFLVLATDLDVMEPKTHDDIYKTHLESRTTVYSAVDSARQNLAHTFVNAFVNAGFRRDKLISEEGTKWIYKNRDHAMMSAVASLGMVLLWDVEGGLAQLDKYIYMSDDNIRAGALLGMGITSCGVRNESDPALALLREQLESSEVAIVRSGCIVGLGIAYAGTEREEPTEVLRAIANDSSLGLDTFSQAALEVGLVNVGTGNGEIAQELVLALMERGEVTQYNTMVRYAALGLGLLFLGRGSEAAEPTVLALEAMESPVGKYAALTVETCAAAGTGDALKVQRMLSLLNDAMATAAEKADAKEKADQEARDAGLSEAPQPATSNSGSGAGDKDESEGGEGEKTELFALQPVAVLGIALVAMSEEIGTEMAFRSFEHLLQYGDLPVRRAVPIALGLISISNPRVTLTDTLSKLSHDADPVLSQSAIFALGMIGAGTNNSRIAGLLRQLATYYQREANHLFVVRLAQGLLHLGKGTMTLQPFNSDRFLLDSTALAGLLVLAHSCFDLKNTLLGRAHYMLFHIACSMFPRMLMTLDPSLKPLPVSARVGQAVDTVGQAGHPKTITGFQTHTTPVLLSAGERAELASNEYIPQTPVLEGFVILEEDPKAVKAKAADMKAKFATPTLPM